MKKYLLGTAISAVILACSVTASAQGLVAVDHYLPFEAGIKAGYTTLTGDFGDAFDDAFSGGLYLNYNYLPSLTFQGSWIYHKHDNNEDAQEALDKIASKKLGMPALTDVRLTMNEFDVNAIYTIPVGMEGIRPYLLAGVGLYYWKLDGKTIIHTDFDKTEEDTFWDFGFDVGGGIDFVVAENVRVGGEITYDHVFDDFDSGIVNFLLTASYGFAVGGM